MGLDLGARLAIASIKLYILSNDAWISVRDNLSLGVTQLTLIARISRLALALVKAPAKKFQSPRREHAKAY